MLLEITFADVGAISVGLVVISISLQAYLIAHRIIMEVAGAITGYAAVIWALHAVTSAADLKVIFFI